MAGRRTETDHRDQQPIDLRRQRDVQTRPFAELKPKQSKFKQPLLCAVISLIAFELAAGGAGAESRLSDYIRPLVGTGGREGNTFPGPSASFGMMQLSPTPTRPPIGTRAPANCL